MLVKTKGRLLMTPNEQGMALTMDKQGKTETTNAIDWRNLKPKDRLIVALDVSTIKEARALMAELAPEVGMFKAGLELWSASGTEIFEAAREVGARLFFDSKLHDIPNTVASACRAISAQGPALFNLHALGGRKMMEAAKAARDEAFDELIKAGGSSEHRQKPALIAVTILTSMSATELEGELKVKAPLQEMVLGLATLARDCGMDGVVASAKEAAAIRKQCGPDFLIVTPGIRPSWSEANDQSRIVTPRDAIAGGADMIVVGRPIVRAKDRRDAARRIVAEMEGA
jgi:orotidine-5'-phosphate decarboxylase